MLLTKYKEIINKNVLNENIKREINDIINYFIENGKIKIEGNNLCGKLKKREDFIQIKYNDNIFLCNYSKWDLRKFVTISSSKLKDNNIKFERKEKNDYKSNDKKIGTKIEEIEEIYRDNKLIYNSDLKTEYKFIIDNKDLKYFNNEDLDGNRYFVNYFDLNKNWYISNGSIINYNLSKMFTNINIKESYSICPKVYHDEFGNHSCFVKLDEELFKSFMSGNMTIEEVLEKIDSEEYYKILTKSIANKDVL